MMIESVFQNPVVSFFLLLQGEGHRQIQRTLQSFILQDSMNWEAIIVADQSIVYEFLAVPEDQRIRILNVDSDSSLLAKLQRALSDTRADVCAVIFPADEIAISTVRTLEEAWEESGGFNLLYVDELITLPNGRERLIAKPDFSPERLRNQNYLGLGVFYSAENLRLCCAKAQELAGAELYDLNLRMVERSGVVIHLALPLYKRTRSITGVSSESACQALENHFERVGVKATVQSNPHSDTFKIAYAISGDPLVSIIIPSGGKSALVRGAQRCLVVEAVREIIENSSYVNYEFIIVLDESSPPEVERELRSFSSHAVRIVPWDKKFNFSAKMNCGVSHAQGEYLLLLNDDVQIISDGWIENMLGIAQQEGVGLVGAMLFFEDGSLQHGGHLYLQGSAGHIGFGWDQNAVDSNDAFLVNREVSGVTAACALVSRSVYFEVGGFSLLLPNNYNDVDFCMKIRGGGYRIIWTPHSQLFHFESKSRVSSIAQYELSFLRSRWNSKLQKDPYWFHEAGQE